MSRSKCRSKGSHRIGKSCLVKGNHIQVAFTDKKEAFPGSPGIIKAVQVPALVKQLCLRGVQVFWFPVPHDAAAKTNDTVIHIHDWEHDTVPELVPAPALFQGHQPGILKETVLITLALQETVQVVAGLIGITQAETYDCIIQKPPFVMEILISKLSLGLF